MANPTPTYREAENVIADRMSAWGRYCFSSSQIALIEATVLDDQILSWVGLGKPKKKLRDFAKSQGKNYIAATSCGAVIFYNGSTSKVHGKIVHHISICKS